ncbi:unnamed protein product [Effrenium voratum]|nr:unnamed protein product [Effrenium voratum]
MPSVSDKINEIGFGLYQLHVLLLCGGVVVVEAAGMQTAAALSSAIMQETIRATLLPLSHTIGTVCAMRAARSALVALPIAVLGFGVWRWRWLGEPGVTRRLASDTDLDIFEGLCAEAATDLGANVSRPFSAFLPERVQQTCREQKPPKGSWLHEGRDWCWVATKRRACYGHHTWREAQQAAFQARAAPATDDTTLEALRRPELCDQPSHGAALAPAASEQGKVTFRIQRREAEFWFDRTVAVYVLNLASASTRWERMSSRLKQLGINATRVDGVDVSEGMEQARKEGLVPFDWNFSSAKQRMVRLLRNSSEEAARRYLESYGPGTVGCAAGHLRALWAAAAGAAVGVEGRPLVLILEDDVWLEDDFQLRLRRLLRSEAPCDWQVISLRSQCPYGACVAPQLARIQPDVNEPEEMCRHGVSYGFYAMLYRASSLVQIANALHGAIWNASAPGCLANDVALAAVSDRIRYYAVPSSQVPGFVQHGDGLSVRSELNRKGEAWLDMVLLKKRQSEHKVKGDLAQEAQMLATYLGFALGTLSSGSLGDWAGRRLPILLAYCGMTVSALGLFLTRSYLALCCGFGCFGLFAGLGIPAAFIAVAEVSPSRLRGVLNATMALAFCSGEVWSALGFRLLLPETWWARAGRACSCGSPSRRAWAKNGSARQLEVLLLVFAFLSPVSRHDTPYFLAARGQEDLREGMELMARMNGRSVQGLSDLVPHHGTQEKAITITEALKTLTSREHMLSVLALSVMFFVKDLAFYGMGAFWPLAWRRTSILGEAKAATAPRRNFSRVPLGGSRRPATPPTAPPTPFAALAAPLAPADAGAAQRGDFGPMEAQALSYAADRGRLKALLALAEEQSGDPLALLPALALADTPWHVGVGIADCTGPAAEVVMMGYASNEHRTAGVHMRLHARAYVIVDPSTEERVAFVNADTWAATEAVIQGVESKLLTWFQGRYYSRRNIIVAGTHTHHGPAGASAYMLFQFSSFGYVDQSLQALVDGISEAVWLAHNNVKPAHIYTGSGMVDNSTVPGCPQNCASRNRSPTSFLHNPEEERTKYFGDDNVDDRSMDLLKFVDAETGEPMGTINWFAVHPVSMTSDYDLISGDNKGYAEYIFEKEINGPSHLQPAGRGPFVASFAQGAAGDVSPNILGDFCTDTGLSCENQYSVCWQNGQPKNELC